MHKTYYPEIDETTFKMVHPSGLKCIVLPKPSYHKTYVTITTPFGANHTEAHVNQKKMNIPLGTAHFLEHKLFDRNGKELSSLFASNHASVNAYTQNNQTTFLFSCSKALEENLSLLIDLTFNPTFTASGVKKEMGIIADEIDMYQDDPYAVMYETLIDRMYHHHPIKNRVLGTKESINEINASILKKIHHTFYHPKKMVMVIAGNIDINTIQATIINLAIPKYDTAEITFPAIDEPNNVVSNQTLIINKDVYIPHSVVGAKCNPNLLDGNHIMKQELIFAMLLELIIGKSSSIHQLWIEKGWINDSFDVDITVEQDAANILFSCNTTLSDSYIQGLLDYLTNLDKITILEADFKRVKKQILGGFMHALNSLEYIANQFTKYHFLNDNIFHILSYSKDITLEDIYNAKNILQKADTTSVIVKKDDA